MNVVLMILDGWGYSQDISNNAVFSARTPNLDKFIKDNPNTFIKCSGMDVGLPRGLMGNSEVGHLNMGSGRIVYQDLTKIDKAIEDGVFFTNENILKAFEIAKSNKSKIHLMGLLSDGGVHSHINHIEALLSMSAKNNFKDVVVHAFFDGRDTAPKIGHLYLNKLFSFFKKYNVGSLGSCSGRYYSMDRDKRWDRVKKGYDAIVNSTPLSNIDPMKHVTESHLSGVGDEFIEPVCLNKENVVADNDVVIFFNFRADRAREITRALTEKDFNGFDRITVPKISYFLCMTEYDEKFNLPVAFSKQELKNIFGEVISNNGLKQLRIAETEKYAHVTFFFNGGKETPFKSEDRILVDSPKDVATYDLKPEMSAYKVTEKLLSEIEKEKYDFIVVNYANCDMVGHTGFFDATVKAVETVDECAGKIVNAVIKKGGVVFLTADHGNAEKMKENGSPYTAHTTGDVRFIVITADIQKRAKIKLNTGRLADVMPTVLDYMDIKIPNEVTGISLIIK